MKIVRLRVSEPLGTCERVHYLPVRIGGHPQNDCQLVDPAISRFHLELGWSHDRFVLRDLGARDSVHVRVAGEMHKLRAGELTSASREIEFAIAGVWVQARVEERRVHHIAEAAQQAVEELLEACAQAATCGDQSDTRRVLAALGRGALALRDSLQAERERPDPASSNSQDEVPAALIRWAQASIAAFGVLEELLALAVE
ncbi:MAG: hypothetical protein PVSMB1_03450 [Gemmatimonadaceae bacterium]